MGQDMSRGMSDMSTGERWFAGITSLGISEAMVAQDKDRVRHENEIRRLRKEKEELRLRKEYQEQLIAEREEERRLARLRAEKEKERREKERREKERREYERERARLQEQWEWERSERNRQRALYRKEQAARAEQKRKLMEANVQNFAGKKEKQFDNYLKSVSNIPDVPKTIKRSVAFLGATSVGKSTMINKLYGTNCKSSPLRCTRGTEMVYDSDKLEVYDLFGMNDEETYANVDVLMTTKALHIVVCIYTDAVDHVLNLARLLNALKLDIVFVRNKCEDFTSEERREVKQHDKNKLMRFVNKEKFLGVIIGSAKTGLGMKALSDTIAMSSNQRIMDDEKIDNAVHISV